MRYLVMLVVIAATVGCASLPRAQSDCAAAGYEQGSNAFAKCVQGDMAQQQNQNSQMMMRLGAAMRSASPAAPAPAAGATGCYFRREVTSGFNKICYYDCMGSERAVTQQAVSLCPLTL